MTTGNVHWPVSVGARITWNLPQIWRAGTPDDRKLLRALATPGLQDDLEKWAAAPYADGIDESVEGDERRALFAEKLLEHYHPALLTVYFTALDHEQHEHGPFAPSVFAVLERIDTLIGRLIETANRVSAGRTVVAIVSDHGFERSDRELHLLAAFRSAGLLRFPDGSDTQPSDWKAAVWPAGGSAAVVLRDPNDADTRSAVQALLDRLAADPAHGIDRVIEEGELRQRGGFPGAAFLVGLRPGFRIGFRTTGPLVTERPAGGTHGYLPDNPNMDAAFMVLGPGIRPGASLGRIDLRDVAPTLAAILGLRLGAAEGQVLPVRQ